jgi:hypothetical protein
MVRVETDMPAQMGHVRFPDTGSEGAPPREKRALLGAPVLNVDAAGDNIHVQRLVELRNWARPLQLPRGKITYHLLESRNVAGAILDFAQSNKVNHIIIGASTTWVGLPRRRLPP